MHMISTNQPRNGMSDRSQIWWQEGNSALAVQLHGYYKWKCRCPLLKVQNNSIDFFPPPVCLSKHEKWNIRTPSVNSKQTCLSSLCPCDKCCWSCQNCRCTAPLVTTGGPKRASSHLPRLAWLIKTFSCPPLPPTPSLNLSLLTPCWSHKSSLDLQDLYHPHLSPLWLQGMWKMHLPCLPSSC